MTDPSYAELHCHSWFSLLDGASSVEQLVNRAVALNLPALAITDHDAVYGVPRFVRAAEAAGIRPIVGAELTTSSGHLTLLVENERGWGNLCALITRARHNAPKGEALLPAEELEGHTNGLIALSGCRKGPVVSALLRKDSQETWRAAQRLRDWFGQDHLYIELQHHLLLHDEALMHALAGLADALHLPVVATNNVHYATIEERRAADVMTCIRHGVTLDEAGRRLRLNAEYRLKSAAEMAERFSAYPAALAATMEIAERCRFELHSGVQDLPVFPVPDGQTATKYLRDLCVAGIFRRYGETSEAVLRQIEHELAVIDLAGLSNYFLILNDLIHFARGQGIRCQGRGSAANSLVAYLLDITPVDPLRHALLFERFLSAERQTTPDVDIDFDAARREEVIQYVYQRYGHAHAAMACTLVTYRARSALRDVGKALNLPPDAVAEAAKWLDTSDPQKLADSPDLQRALGSRWMSNRWAKLLDVCRQLDGAPRHLGIHNGGMVVTGPPLNERLPTEPATMPGRFVVQWDKDGLEDAGMVKIDILGLRMLSAISDAVEHVYALTGQSLDLGHLTHDDPAVYRMISAADTIGVFQVESRAQAQILPRLRPRCFNDVIISISLIRPGPVQGNMVHPYLRRRDKSEPITYLDSRLEPALSETLGVVLFQEQVLKVARDIAGFTPGQGELLRRALGSKRAEQELAALEHDFVEGAVRQGVPEATARQIYNQLRGFAGYSFPKSHAAAFAVLVYQSAWLRLYHPLPFYLGLLNNQPMGFWSPAVILGDAERRKIR
ncbi:MAG: DNA polymerase III subunit alpha, partial [Anaerolineae bacterium]|nr:DNA polymerase III subunit alpha [Anaerolineae bacterium]